MIRIATLFACATLACAGADNHDLFEDYEADAGAPEELGQVAQAFSAPDWYGTIGSGGKCPPGFTGCQFPSTRTRKVKFYASTCSTWWQTRLVEAESIWKHVVEAAGWTYITGASGTQNIEIRCDLTGNKCPGAFGCYTERTMSCDATRCMVSAGKVYLNIPVIESANSDFNWATLTETQRKRYGRNAWVHEVGHAFGLGHEEYGFFQDPGVISPDYQWSAMYTNSLAKINNSQSLNHTWIFDKLQAYVP